MNALMKWVFACAVFSILGLAGLWWKEQEVSAGLAAEVREARGQLVELEAAFKGMREANEALHRQVAEWREAPPLYTDLSQTNGLQELPPMRISLAESEQMPMEMAVSERAERPQPMPLTPEQVAERERRLQEWSQRREDFRKQMVSEVADRRAFFAQVSTEGLAPEYRAGHERLLQAMDEVEALMNRMGDPELSRDDRREVFRALGQVSGEVRELMGRQREILLNDYAQQALGLNNRATKEFIDYMQTINRMTSSAPMHSMVGGSRGRTPRAPEGVRGDGTP